MTYKMHFLQAQRKSIYKTGYGQYCEANLNQFQVILSLRILLNLLFTSVLFKFN